MNNDQNGSKIDMLISLVIGGGNRLVLDQQSRPFIVLSTSPHIVRPIRSPDMKGLLAKLYWEKFQKILQRYSLDSAIGTLEGIALSRGERVVVFNRVAQIGGTIYYDLGDDSHVVKIDSSGWEVVDTAPVLFKRYKHQFAQVLSDREGDICEIVDYLNISNEDQKILLITYLVVALFPNIPRQLLLVHGPQGSGKSTALTMIRSLIDPSVVPLLSPPADQDDVVRDADHNYCYYLDNISGIDRKLSDSLCRLVTGMSFTKRELYTVDDDVIYSFKRAVALNGVAQFASNPDLLDRALIIQLERIGEQSRKLDGDLLEQFEQQKPKLLGGIFSAVSGVLANLEEVRELDLKLPRMADYYIYAVSAAQYLGFGVERFVEAYAQNVNEQNQESLNASLVGILILEFMSIHGDRWEGSAQALHSQLTEQVDDRRTISGLPRTSIWLWRKIQEIKPTLEAMGIIAEKDDTGRPRKIVLSKTNNFRPVQIDNLTVSPFAGTQAVEQQANTTNIEQVKQNVTGIDVALSRIGKTLEQVGAEGAR